MLLQRLQVKLRYFQFTDIAIASRREYVCQQQGPTSEGNSSGEEWANDRNASNLII